MSEVEGEKETENVEGKASEETSETVPETDSQEDVIKPGLPSISSLEQQKEADEEKSQKALTERIANLEKELAERKVARSNAASVQEAGTVEATAAEEAHTDGNGQDPTPTNNY